MVSVVLAILEAILSGITAMWRTTMGRTVLIASMAAAFGLWQGVSFMSNRLDSLRKKHAAEIVRVLASRDAEWQAKLGQAEANHKAVLDEAIQARNVVVVPATNSDLQRMCGDAASGTDCRSAKRNGVRGVQGN